MLFYYLLLITKLNLAYGVVNITSRPENTDGNQYIEKIIKRDSGLTLPRKLVFTAPYRLCEEGCDINANMIFPLYVGVTNDAHKRKFSKEHAILNRTLRHPPFRKRTTRYRPVYSKGAYPKSRGRL